MMRATFCPHLLPTLLAERARIDRGSFLTVMAVSHDSILVEYVHKSWDRGSPFREFQLF